MIRRPSRSNRTYTLFPYSTPFRPPRVAPRSSDRAPSGRQPTDRLPPRAAPRNADLRARVEARRRRRDRQRARASARKRPAGRGRLRAYGLRLCPHLGRGDRQGADRRSIRAGLILPVAKPWGGGPLAKRVVEGPRRRVMAPPSAAAPLPPPHGCATGRL